MAFSFMNPSVPFKGDFFDGLAVESEILILGQTPSASKGFSVNLCSQHDLPLHVNPRFEQDCIIRNHLVAGKWGPEEKYPHGMDELVAGRTFEITIRTEETHYEVAVNGLHMFDFVHRLPFESIRMLYITGDVILNRVEHNINDFRDPPPAYSEHVNSTSKPVPIIQAPVRLVSRPFRNPVLPLLYPVLGGLRAGYIITLIGKPTNKATSFAVDLLCGPGSFPPADIAMHLNPRFYSSIVMRNSCLNDNWGPEETCGPPFPFRRGANFEIVITTHSDFFDITVDGKSCAIFQHRVKPLMKIDYINIKGDVEIFLMNIERTTLLKEDNSK